MSHSFPAPRKIVTDQLRGYPAAKAGIPALADVKAAVRVNSRQPTRKRERRMRGFRDLTRTHDFLDNFGPIRRHFALKRHLLRTLLYQTGKSRSRSS